MKVVASAVVLTGSESLAILSSHFLLDISHLDISVNFLLAALLGKGISLLFCLFCIQ